VIINDLDLAPVAIMPYKTDPPLVVDSNAVLALPIADELLEPVSRGNPEILQRLRVVQHARFRRAMFSMLRNRGQRWRLKSASVFLHRNVLITR
jgi:hypothetical protein